MLYERSMRFFITLLQRNKKPTGEKLDCLYCNKTPEQYGIKSQPSKAELDQIDHLSRSAQGPAGEGHMLFHKVRRLSAVQHNTEHNLQPSLHAVKARLSCPSHEVAKCQVCIHLETCAVLKCKNNQADCEV